MDKELAFTDGNDASHLKYCRFAKNKKFKNQVGRIGSRNRLKSDGLLVAAITLS